MRQAVQHLPNIKVATLVRDLLEENERLKQAVERRVVEVQRAGKADTEIMEACSAVARATDALQQARFAGVEERTARRALEAASRELARVMRRHGRMPESP
jgi:hypothetical protein